MATFAASSNSIVDPIEDELPIEVADPYLDNLGDFGLEFVEDKNEDNIAAESEEDEADVIDKKPYVGMRFQIEEEAYNFYNSYAGRVGFSVRRATHGKNKNGISSIRFVCSKHDMPHSQKKKEMPIGSLTCPKRKESQKEAQSEESGDSGNNTESEESQSEDSESERSE